MYDVGLNVRGQIQQPLARMPDILPGLFHPGQPERAFKDAECGDASAITPLVL
jgi:hypothetical protein